MKYTQSHEWYDTNTGRVGITEFARKELGEIVHIELPTIGTHLEAGEEVAVVESTKSAADIYTPISGRITAINEELAANPNLINTSPESLGWLYQIESTNPTDHATLLDHTTYQSMINS